MVHIVEASGLPNILALVEDSLPGPSGQALPRRISMHSTISLPAGVSEQSTISMAVGFRVYQVTTSVPARVRLYDTVAHQAADISRSVGFDPGGGVGLVLDVLTADSAPFPLSPQALGASLESIPSAQVPITTTATVSGPVIVTILWVETE